MRKAASYRVDASEPRRNLQALLRDMPGVEQIALRELGKHLRREMRAETPVEEGFLRKGIRYRVYARGAGQVELVLTASSTSGGADHEYALIVHEDLEAAHDVGGPKFIERPLVKAVVDKAILQIIADTARNRLLGRMGYNVEDVE